MDASTSQNRRSGHDLRALDLGPPAGQEERRKLPERRHPQVWHFEFDEHVELHPFDHSPGDVH